MNFHLYGTPSAPQIERVRDRMIEAAKTVEIISAASRAIEIERGSRGSIPIGIQRVYEPFNRDVLLQQSKYQDVWITPGYHSPRWFFSSADDPHEEPIPAHTVGQCGKDIGRVREMANYGALQGCTNVFYAGGASSRSIVASTIDWRILRRVHRSLAGNRAELVTVVSTDGEPMVRGCYLAYCHGDVADDIQQLENFEPAGAYGPPMPGEIGWFDQFRFITSPMLEPVLAAGASIAGTGLKGDRNADIYPIFVLADKALGAVPLNEKTLEINVLPAHMRDKTDPHGEFWCMAARFPHAAAIENDGWMAKIEVAVTDLPGQC